jgi:hypothetical protein
MLVLTLISYVGNVAVIFGYFYPLNPTGAAIYSGWLTLGYVLGWLGMPKVADATDWARLLRKKRGKTREREDLDKQPNGQLDD